ncbi:SBBP repeat-containing protein [Bacillus timonensis]|nr:SBBP repeat-containing protein [Bacillus timonensis]
MNQSRKSVNVLNSYGKIPLFFEENVGQTSEQVKYLSKNNRSTVFFKNNEVVSFLRKPLKKNEKSEVEWSTNVVRMKFLNAKHDSKIEGVDKQNGTVNYFKGNDDYNWNVDIPTYSKIRYKQIYPGINLIFYGNQRNHQFDFIIEPGYDFEKIAIEFEGIDSIDKDEYGKLELHFEGGSFVIHQPYIYQQYENEQKEIKGSFKIIGRNKIGFSLKEQYDKKKQLVIDPVLDYSTFLGGSADDSGFGIAVDSAGNTYVTGSTRSSNFPTVNAIDANIDGPEDVFITKINSAGDAIVYSTYLGGSSNDFGQSIAVDSAGNAYITGSTTSSNFPTVNAIDTSYNGNEDAFVTKINAAGNAIVYSTFLGGSSVDRGNSIVVDSTGNAYIAGATRSSNFPTQNAIDPSFNGDLDGFVTKINAAGNAIVYSTYLGGSSLDAANSIDIDSSGNAYITGQTRSSNFPTVNAIDPTFNGVQEAFVTKINAAGNAIVYSTFLGGSGNDAANGIAVDSSGNAYISGITSSSDFPTVNAIDPSFNGVFDVFITKINAAGNAIVYSTYLGGSSEESSRDIAVDVAGNAYVTGRTNSSDFPVVNAIDSCFNGVADAFVTKINALGNAIVYSTFLGGNAFDQGHRIAVDNAGSVYVTGFTSSSDFPTKNAIDPTYNGGVDAFVVKISDQSTEELLQEIIDLLENPNFGLEEIKSEVRVIEDAVLNTVEMKKVHLQVIELKEKRKFLISATEAGKPVDVQFISIKAANEKDLNFVELLGNSTITIVQQGLHLVEIDLPKGFKNPDIFVFQVEHSHGLVTHFGTIMVSRKNNDNLA